MSNNFGLGRGLASLIPDKKNKIQESANLKWYKEDKKATNGILELEINLIDSNPHQPRFQFDKEKLEALAQSIKLHGIIQPLVVSSKNGRYELIAGERRFIAAQKAGLKKVPAIVRQVEEKEKLELALIENIQRHDLNPIEEAKAYKKLTLDFQMSQEEIAERVGKNRSVIANKMRLLNLSMEIQKAIIESKITEGHARAILALSNAEKQRALFDIIIKQNLTVRQSEDKVKEVSVKSHKRAINIDPEIKNLEDKLTGALGTRVKIVKSRSGGRILIDYYSKEELENIIEKLV